MKQSESAAAGCSGAGEGGTIAGFQLKPLPDQTRLLDDDALDSDDRAPMIVTFISSCQQPRPYNYSSSSDQHHSIVPLCVACFPEVDAPALTVSISVTLRPLCPFCSLLAARGIDPGFVCGVRVRCTGWYLYARHCRYVVVSLHFPFFPLF